jgi:hypothetical protein
VAVGQPQSYSVGDGIFVYPICSIPARPINNGIAPVSRMATPSEGLPLTQILQARVLKMGARTRSLSRVPVWAGAGSASLPALPWQRVLSGIATAWDRPPPLRTPPALRHTTPVRSARHLASWEGSTRWASW